MSHGALLLAGSGEFRLPMVPADAELLRHTPGDPPKVAILPTAAGQEVSVSSWIRDGIAHFSALGCEAYGVRAVDRAGVEDPDNVAAVEAANLVYLSGGSPGHLVETLRGSAVWQAIVRVWERGGALAGSSAGAMALGEWTLVRREGQVGRMPAHWEPGLNLLPGAWRHPALRSVRAGADAGPDRRGAALADDPRHRRGYGDPGRRRCREGARAGHRRGLAGRPLEAVRGRRGATRGSRRAALTRRRPSPETDQPGQREPDRDGASEMKDHVHAANPPLRLVIGVGTTGRMAWSRSPTRACRPSGCA